MPKKNFSKKIRARFNMIVLASLLLFGIGTTVSLAKYLQTQSTNEKVGASATNASKPSEVFDLSIWKLTLPIDTKENGKSPDEIVQPELSTYTSDYFKLNSTRDAITFKSPAGGSTTGKSSYARSELRERKSTPFSFTSDCTELRKPEEACWSTSIGYHIMTIDQKITRIPTTKAHVVVGQIHDQPDDVTVFRLEGKTLFVDANRYSKPDIILTNNYELGTRFTVSFEVYDDQTIYYYNGQEVGSLPVKYKNGYFKAGMYVQSNEQNNQFGEVDIYDVKVCHASSKAAASSECGSITPSPTPSSSQATATPVPTIKVSATPQATSTPKPGISVKPTTTPKPASTATPTPRPTTIGKISGIQATSPKDSRVVLTWNAYPGATKYRILMSKNNANSFKEQDSTSKTTKTFNLPSCKTNYFRVVAYDKKNNKIATSDTTSVLVAIGSPVRPCNN